MKPRFLVGFALALAVVTTLPGLAEARKVHFFDCSQCHKPGMTIFALGNGVEQNPCLACHSATAPANTTLNGAYGSVPTPGRFYANDASNAMGSYPDAGLLTGAAGEQTSHMWATSTDVKPAAGAVAPIGKTYFGRAGISKNKITCSRCHDPHDVEVADGGNPSLLREDNTNDTMCLNCHRNWGLANTPTDYAYETHPIVSDYVAAATAANAAATGAGRPAKYKIPMTNAGAPGINGDVRLVDDGAANLGVSCSSCHGAHFTDSSSDTVDGAASSGTLVAGDGKILRSDGRVASDANRSSALCQACHTYKKHGSANTIGCLDCHSGHSYNGGSPNYFVLRGSINNIYLPKNSAIGNVAGLTYASPTADWMNAGGTGYCQKCHNLGASHNGYASGNAATNCIACHSHDKVDGSFTANCTQCHGYPPVQNLAGGDPNSGYAFVSGTRDYSADGNFKDETLTGHNRHAGSADYDLACDRCHDGAFQSGTHNDNNFQNLVFDAISSQGLVPSYDKTGSGTCASVYCHSNGGARTGDASRNYVAAVIPAWAGGSIANCTSCHGNDSATMTASQNSATHQDHLAKGYGCGVCHNNTASNATTLAVGAMGGAHVDGDVDVAFNSAFGLGAGTLGAGTYTPAAGTCSIYCHSDGRGTNATPDWDSAASGACGTCHKWDVGSGNPMSTYAHGAHINDSGSQIGRNIGCAECHSNTVSNNTTISTPANHVNGGFNLGIAADGNKTACSNISCHSDGNFDGTLVYKNQTWTSGTTLAGCDDCHGDGAGKAYPTYANGGLGGVDANSHSAHVVGGGYACGDCHSLTSTAGISIDGTNPLKHVNQTVDVAGAKITSWTDGTKTCSNVSCHGGNNPVWGDSLGCADCHVRSAGDLDDFTYNNATMAMVDAEEWTYSGHGLAALGTYEVTGRAGADFPAKASGVNADPCLYCHDGGISHGSANYFRLRQNGEADLNGACLGCHKTGSAGVDPDAAGTDYASVNSSVKIDKYHGGAKHNGTDRDAGRWCWDCHDPHGDADGASQRIQMVQRRLAVNPDANGIPASLTATDVVFYDNTKGADALGGFARSVGSYGEGVCNACHTTTAQYTQIAGDNGHYTTLCVGCHGHSGDTNYDQLAFKATCYNCHGGDVSGTNNNSYWPGSAVTTVDNPGSVNDSGEHAVHITQLALKVYGESIADLLTDNTAGNPAASSDLKQRTLCGYCHASPGADGDHATGDDAEVTQFQRIWDGTANDITPGVPAFTRADGTCSNIDCHNDQATAAATYGWYDGGSSACVLCHAANTTTTGTHFEHLNTGSVYYAAGQIGCTDCHEAGTDWATNSKPSVNHINGTKNAFNYNAGTSTCATNTCHNDGKNGAPANTPTWGVANGVGCSFCHTNSSEAHASHFNAEISGKFVAGGTFWCTACHTHSGPNTDHFNATVNVKATLNYSGNVVVGTAGFGTCNTTSCHQDGKNTPVVTPAWDRTPSAADDCTLCHGGVPATGSHAKHVKVADVPADYTSTVNNTTAADYSFACSACHGNAVANHMNGAPTLAGGVGYSANTCTTSYCHSNGNGIYTATPIWGNSFAGDRCAGCHLNSPGTNAHHEHEVGFHYDAVYSGLTGFLPVVDSDYPGIDPGLNQTFPDQLRGHGGNLNGSGASTSTTITCYVCHFSTVKNWYNANNTTCATCHTAVANPTAGDMALGNAALDIADKTFHVNAVKDVVFFNQKVRSKAQIRDKLSDVPELGNNWTRVNGYKANDGISFDEQPNTLDNMATWNSTDKTCTVSCHLWETGRVDKVPVKWDGGAIMCIDCHSRLPK